MARCPYDGDRSGCFTDHVVVGVDDVHHATVGTEVVDAFELLELTVDGVRRAVRTGAQVYTASLGDGAMAGDRRVAISYTHRLLIQQHGHLLHLDISRPAKGLRVQFAYGACGIRHVNVLDYIAGSNQTRLSRLPASGPTPSIALGFDGWVLPKAGIAFASVLEREIAALSEPDIRPLAHL
jgi:hypothetical protein